LRGRFGWSSAASKNVRKPRKKNKGHDPNVSRRPRRHSNLNVIVIYFLVTILFPVSAAGGLQGGDYDHISSSSASLHTVHQLCPRALQGMVGLVGEIPYIAKPP
jgi:hypothetical protein